MSKEEFDLCGLIYSCGAAKLFTLKRIIPMLDNQELIESYQKEMQEVLKLMEQASQGKITYDT